MLFRPKSFRGLSIKLVALVALACWWIPTIAQDDDDDALSAGTFAGLELRTIGPAFMSGRIADIALHPDNPNVWYVAVGSGGVWKTVNSGTTWNPIFDGQNSYSIGAITLDPSNPNTVWVGTGENIGGRNVGYGDGIYVSHDGGSTWNNVGLESSEHISKIVIHPEDPNTVWVAAQGPLWSPGGERGLYKTTDGGKNWNRTLVGDDGDNRWTGVTDIVIDPRDPDVLYAATWQRHRTVASYVGGGPNSGIHRSADGGETWTELTNGLPSSDDNANLGKIGLAISPQQPDVLYAAIETDRRTGGVWRSADRGASWQKMSDKVAGGTGPHYYQEIYASPHKFDRVYFMDVRAAYSDDGGKNWTSIASENKHVDNHALAFRSNDPNYLLMGSDGGLYETFDHADAWRYVDNLPVTQFYKVAVDDAEPFYTVYGGTQDNNTQGGPSRTDNVHGVRNADWFVVLFGDGHQPATEPGNPDIVYAHWQQGNLVRADRTTGEIVYIQPQVEPGQAPNRFNWDAPILVSPHDPTRIYHASQRVWRSDNRGDSWTMISDDLTRNQERIELDVMGRQWSWDAPWDMYAMSDYNTITSLAESPVVEGLLYAGTDDGLIQISDNGGDSWRTLEVGKLPGVPATAFVNDIRADLHDADTVYVALDNHKYGDFKPYLLVSRNRGRSWSNIGDGLPDRHLVWRMVQDHERADLLFAGTEFGVFFTLDAGGSWHKLWGAAPTIGVRDLQIQRRENDLVAGTFGRGIYILDDYSALRDLDAETLAAEASLFEPRDALWYIERSVMGARRLGSQGDGLYAADNPPFGAVFTYHLAEGFSTLEAQRQQDEKARLDKGQNVGFVGWDAVEAERRETPPALKLIIRDANDQVIRRVDAPAGKGFQRVAWDLRHPYSGAVETPPNWQGQQPRGFLAMPGDYSAQLVLLKDGKTRSLTDPVTVTVKRLYEGALQGAALEKVDAFWRELSALSGRFSAARYALDDAVEDVEVMQSMLAATAQVPGELDERLHTLRQALYDLDQALSGHRSKQAIGDYEIHRVGNWLMHATAGVAGSTYGPTPAHERSLRYAAEAFAPIRDRLNSILTEELPELREALLEHGAPWGRGQSIPED